MGWRIRSLVMGMPGLAALLLLSPSEAAAGEIVLGDAERRWLA
jgi:hypothetical protein